MIKLKSLLNENNNLKVRKEALYKINYMLRYSQRLGSDEKSDLKELAKIVSKIKFLNSLSLKLYV